MFTKMIAASLLATSAMIAAPAMAADVADGTVSVAALYNPVVDLVSAPSTYTATMGTTFQVSGQGGFTGVSGLLGQMNGTLSFSSTIGTTLAQSLANFFVFNDGVGGTYNFSVDSVRTQSFNHTPGVSSNVALYLLGTTTDVFQGLSPTLTSLTLSFNNTVNSNYSASATLAVPPADVGSVPEPISWALMLVGFGAIGATMRRRSTTLTFG